MSFTPSACKLSLILLILLQHTFELLALCDQLIADHPAHRTPWLTTRRRTCPICKGDVVRMSGSTARPPSLHSDSSDDEDIVQTRAAENRNDSPSAAMPISTDAADDDYADLESGHEREASERPNDFMTAMYRAFERLGLSRFSDTERRGRQSLPDRDR